MSGRGHAGEAEHWPDRLERPQATDLKAHLSVRGVCETRLARLEDVGCVALPVGLSLPDG